MGNKLHYGIVDEVERNVFEVVFRSEADAGAVARWFNDVGTPGIYTFEGDDDGARWCVRADLAKLLPNDALREFVIGMLAGWRMGAEGG